MTMDEYLEDVRRAHGDTDTDVWLVAQVTRLLAIIEAQRAELEKAERIAKYAAAPYDFEARSRSTFEQWIAEFGGNAAIAKRFEENGL